MDNEAEREKLIKDIKNVPKKEVKVMITRRVNPNMIRQLKEMKDIISTKMKTKISEARILEYAVDELYKKIISNE